MIFAYCIELEKSVLARRHFAASLSICNLQTKIIWISTTLCAIFHKVGEIQMIEYALRRRDTSSWESGTARCRKDETRNGHCKNISESWMIITGLFSNGSFEENPGLWPFRIPVWIPMTPSGPVASATGCDGVRDVSMTRSEFVGCNRVRDI